MTMTIEAPSPAAVIDFRSFVRVLARRRVLIAAIAGACLLGALLIAILMSPRFVSEVKILIDPRGLQILPNDLNPNAASTDVTFAVLDSQIQLITSTEVLHKVIDKLHLNDDPEFSLEAAALPASVAPPNIEAKTWATLRALRKRIEVRRPDRTFVLTVSVWTHTSADKSKRIADAIGDAYLTALIQNHAEIADRTAAALDARLTVMQQQLNKAEKELETYRIRNNLIGGNGRLLNERELTDLTNQLSAQRIRTSELKARIDTLRQRNNANTSIDTIAEALQSPTINDLRSRYAEAKKAEADSQVLLGPRHPAVIAAHAQVAQIRELINNELVRLQRALDTEYERSKAVETALNQQIISARELASSGQPAIVKLHSLEKNVAAQRAIYETMQRRAKEIREEAGLNPGNARIISPAAEQPAQFVIPRTLIVAGGLFVGLLAGIFAAALLNQTDSTIWSADELFQRTRLFNIATLSRKRVMAAGAGQLTRGVVDAAGLSGLPDILKVALQKSPGGVLVVSADQSDASGAFALALAAQCAHDGYRVLAVDSTKTKYLTRACKLENRPGLSESNTIPLTLLKVEMNGLQVVPAGTREPDTAGNALLAGQASTLFSGNDITLIDGGSFGNSAFMSLLDLISVVLIVATAGRSRSDRINGFLHRVNPRHDRLIATIFLA
jgi:uncharacterized protein involved in exopolysaccharide biosynthesis